MVIWHCVLFLKKAKLFLKEHLKINLTGYMSNFAYCTFKLHYRQYSDFLPKICFAKCSKAFLLCCVQSCSQGPSSGAQCSSQSQDTCSVTQRIHPDHMRLRLGLADGWQCQLSRGTELPELGRMWIMHCNLAVWPIHLCHHWLKYAQIDGGISQGHINCALPFFNDPVFKRRVYRPYMCQ